MNIQMATWIAHLRTAEELLNRFPQLDAIPFLIGNIAPDSGVPNEDGTDFIPSKQISHFKKHGAHPERFRELYMKDSADPFFVGYYVHLFTDVLWVQEIFLPELERYGATFSTKREREIALKGDWYGQDHLFLRRNPDFKALRTLREVRAFPNTYLDFFPVDAFERSIRVICGFYDGFRDSLDREFPYLSAEEMDRFIHTAVEAVADKLDLHSFAAGGVH